MSIETSGQLVLLGYDVIQFALPVLLFLLLRRRRHDRKRSFAIAVAVSSLAVIAYRASTLRITIAYVTSLQNPNDDAYGTYDGISGNVFVLVLGWLQPALVLAVVIAVIRLWRWLRGPRPVPPCSTVPGSGANPPQNLKS